MPNVRFGSNAAVRPHAAQCPLCAKSGHLGTLLAARAHGMAYATPQQAVLICPKMNRLNFRVNRNAFDDPGQERDVVSTWLRALAIAVLAIGAMFVGVMLSDNDAIEFLRTIVVRL